MIQDGVYFLGNNGLFGEFQQFFGNLFFVFLPVVFFQLNTYNRFLLGARPDTHQGTPENMWMAIKYGLTGNGKEGLGLSYDAVAFSPAKPEPSFRVDPSKIPHAMPHTGALFNL